MLISSLHKWLCRQTSSRKRFSGVGSRTSAFVAEALEERVLLTDPTIGNWIFLVNSSGTPGTPDVSVTIPAESVTPAESTTLSGNQLAIHYRASDNTAPQYWTFLTDGFYRIAVDEFLTSYRSFSFFAPDGSDADTFTEARDNSTATSFEVAGVNERNQLVLNLNYRNEDSPSGQRFDVQMQAVLNPPTSDDPTHNSMTVQITVTNRSGASWSTPWEGHRAFGEHASMFGISSMHVIKDLSDGVPAWFQAIDVHNEYVGNLADADPLNDGRSPKLAAAGVDPLVSTHDVSTVITASQSVVLDHDMPETAVPGYTDKDDLVVQWDHSKSIEFDHEYDDSRNQSARILSATGVVSDVTQFGWNVAYTRDGTIGHNPANDELVDGDNIQAKLSSPDLHNWADNAAQTITASLVAGSSPVGISLSDLDGEVTVDESGTMDTFTVVLDTAPAGDVVIDLDIGGSDELSLDTTSLTFDADNWNQPQLVTVTGVNDTLADGRQTTTITASVNSGLSDDAWDALPPQTLLATTSDDESQTLTLNIVDPSINEHLGVTTATVTRNAESDLTRDLVVDVSALRGDVTFEEITAGRAQVLVLPEGTVLSDGGLHGLGDLGFDSASGEVALTGYIETELGVRTPAVFTIPSSRDSVTAETPLGLGPDTLVLGISSDASRIAGVSKSPGSVDVGEGTTWLRNDLANPIGVGFAQTARARPTTVAGGAWADGVVGDFAGGDGGFHWMPSTGLVPLTGHSFTSGFTVGVTDDGRITVGTSTLKNVSGGATFWTETAIVPLADPFGGQSVSLGVSPDGNWIGGWVFELQPPFSVSNHPAVWDKDRNLTLIRNPNGSAYQGRVQDVSNAGYAVGGRDTDQGFIWHPTFDGVLSPFNGPQIFDEWLLSVAGITLPTLSTDVVAIAEDTANGMLLFAVEGTDEAYFVQVNAQFLSQADSLIIPAGASSQQFGIRAVDNSIDDGDRDETVTVTGFGYGSAVDTLRVIDDDTIGYTAMGGGDGLQEYVSPALGYINVVLTAQPQSDVTFTVSNSDPTEGAVDRSTLVFTPSNWNVTQGITVSSLDDDIEDGDQVWAVTVSVDQANTASAFDGLPDTVLTFTTIDNDPVDLVATGFNVPDDHVLDSEIQFIYTLENIGSGGYSDVFSTHIVWSLNNVLGDDDDLILPETVDTIDGRWRGSSLPGLASGESLQRVMIVPLDSRRLYEHAVDSNPPGQPVGTVSTEASYFFLVVDTGHEVGETNEANNSGQGHLIDSDDITWFPWDRDLNGVISPLDAIKAIQAIGTNDPSSDFDGNGIVTPLEALAVLQRIGYVRNESVIGDTPAPGLIEVVGAAARTDEQELTTNAMVRTADPTVSVPPEDDDESGLFDVEVEEAPVVLAPASEDLSDLDTEFSESIDWLSVL